MIEDYKILNNLTPEYLRNLYSWFNSKIIRMRTDRDNVLPARTRMYRCRLFPDTSNAWNLLSSFIKISPSLSIFKQNNVDFFIVKPNTIYGIHNPIALRYLTRLRVRLIYAFTIIGIILKTRKPIFVLARKIRQKLWNTSYYSALSIIS